MSDLLVYVDAATGAVRSAADGSVVGKVVYDTADPYLSTHKAAEVLSRLRTVHTLDIRDIVQVRALLDTVAAERSDAASLITTLTAEREALAKALDRQCDNMAFVVNHVSLHAWYDKFKNELEQDRAALSLGAKQ